MTGNRKITLEGHGPLSLSDNDHIATGGEGSVYKKSGYVIKLYTDTQKMKRDGMPEKIKLLSAIKHRFIVAPQGLVLNQVSSDPVGYYMDFASGAEALSRFFTNDFRDRSGFTNDNANTLVKGMRETVICAHQHKAVLVDANELNWMAVPGKTPEPRVIDVDSWAIGKFPAKVIMPSIRDWHSKQFNELTDWFSWGIVTFQIYSGIHPYKGMLDGYKPIEMERRMKDNASVFSPGVRLNRAVRDFNCIPARLIDWYIATFQQGKREMPPSPFDTGVAVNAASHVKRVVVTQTGALVFDKLFYHGADPAVRVFHCGVVLLESGRLIDLETKKAIGKVDSLDCEIVKLEKGWLIGENENGRIAFSCIYAASLQKEVLDFQLMTNRLVGYANRLFAVTDQGLTEVNVTFFGNKAILSAKNTWGVLINSTSWFNGVGIQDAMGAMFLVAPFGDNAVTQTRVKELDGLKAVAAKAGNRFITVIAVDKKGEYQKLEFTFSSDYTSYQVVSTLTDSPELNIAMLPKGVCASIVEDGELVLFVPLNGRSNKVLDAKIDTQMRLYNWGDKVVYIKNGVWTLSLKQ